MLTDNIDISEISCDLPMPHSVEALANSFLALGGTMKPLIVTRTSIMSFKVVANEKVYWAAVLANKIDPDFEAIRAYVVKPEQIETVKAQLEMIG